MRTGRPLAIVTISVEQREELENWSRRPKTAQPLAMRSRIVLLAADGCNNRSIAKQLSTTAQTVACGDGAFSPRDATVCWMNRVRALRAS